MRFTIKKHEFMWLHILISISVFPYLIETSEFSNKSASYWANVPATMDGVLGGFGHLSDVDIDGSEAFLEKVFALENPPGTKRALDCGAGIGRVSKNLLMTHFDKVDLVERNEKFVSAAIEQIGQDNAKLGTVYQVSLQNFKFEKQYDIIWCQGVLCYLDDHDILDFLEKCKIALAINGVIIIKENVSTSENMDFDAVDWSVTRSLDHMMKLFNNTHLQVLLSDVQKGFPEYLYPIHLFALAPMKIL